MLLDPEQIELLANLTRSAALVVLYAIVGFGPGFIFGLLIANRIWARGNPTLKQIHEQSIEAGLKHNKQWHPSDARWQKR